MPEPVARAVFREGTALVARMRPGGTKPLGNALQSVSRLAGTQRHVTGFARAAMRDGLLEALFARCCRPAPSDKPSLVDRLDKSRSAYLSVRLDPGSSAYRALRLHLSWLAPSSPGPFVVTAFLPAESPEKLQSWIDSRMTDDAPSFVATMAGQRYLQVSALLPATDADNDDISGPPAPLKAAATGGYYDAATRSSPAFRMFTTRSADDDLAGAVAGYIHLENLSRLAVAWSHHFRRRQAAEYARDPSAHLGLPTPHRTYVASHIARSSADHLEQTAEPERDVRDYTLRIHNNGGHAWESTGVASLARPGAEPPASGSSSTREALATLDAPGERTLLRLVYDRAGSDEYRPATEEERSDIEARWNAYEFFIGTPFVYAAAQPARQLDFLASQFGRPTLGLVPVGITSHLRAVPDQRGPKLPLSGRLEVLAERAIDDTLRRRWARWTHLTSIDLALTTDEIGGVDRLLRLAVNPSGPAGDTSDPQEQRTDSAVTDRAATWVKADIDASRIARLVSDAVGEALPQAVRSRLADIGDILGRVSFELRRRDHSIRWVALAGQSDGWSTLPAITLKPKEATSGDQPACLQRLRRASRHLVEATHEKVTAAVEHRRQIAYPGRPEQAFRRVTDAIEDCRAVDILSERLADFATTRAGWISARPAAAFVETHRRWRVACERGDQTACGVVGQFSPSDLTSARNDLRAANK